MRLLLTSLILFVSLSAAGQSERHHIPFDRDDHGPDIPRVGSSLFDKLFSETDPQGRARYQVPYPLASLLDYALDERGGVVHTMLPISRSLQRPQDLSYDPLLNPRIVLAPISDLRSQMRGRFFLGYVEAKDQLEVISYNDEAGRFEFQIVTNYRKNPQVFYVNRGKCLSCHQGQAPIFSPPGWDDTAFGVMGELIMAKLGLERNDSVHREEATRRLFGPIRSHDNVAMFDSMVREAAQISLEERVWRWGCGEDNKCRLGLLIRTLSPTSSESNEYFNHSREVIARSEIRAQGTYSSFIRATSLRAQPLIKKHGSAERLVSSPEAILELIGGLYNMEPRDNPATLRPKPLDEGDLATPLRVFLPSDRELLSREIANPNTIAEILIRRFLKNDPTLFAGAINKNYVMWVLLQESGSDEAIRYEEIINKQTPEKVLFQGAFPPIFQTRELNLFSRHCHSCHATGGRFPPQFLVGKEDEVLRKIGLLKGGILFKLENDLMPPKKSDRELLRASGDYETLVNYLKALE